MKNTVIKIMIINDNDDDIYLLTDILKKHFGKIIQINTFNNSSDAIKSFKTDKDYAVILVDVRIPEIDGIRLLKNLKIPILMITEADTSSKDISDSFSRGAYDIIMKPHTEEETTILINKVGIFLNIYKEKKKIEYELDKIKKLSKSELEIQIAARRVAEEELFREKYISNQYLQMSGTMLVALDSNGIIRLVNKKTYEILNYPNGELIGCNWIDNIIPKEYRNDVKNIFRKLMNGEMKIAKNYENPVVTKDGEIRIIKWYNTLITQDDKIIGTLSSGEDITDQQDAKFKLNQAHLELEEAVEILKVGNEISSKIMKQGLDISIDILLKDIVKNLNLNKAFLYKFTDSIEKFGEWSIDPLCTSIIKVKNENDIVKLMNWVYSGLYCCGYVCELPDYLEVLFPNCSRQKCKTCHAVIFPIIIEKKPWGVMGFTKSVDIPCSNATIKALKNLSSIISIVIKQQEENKTLLKMIDERMKIFKTKIRGDVGHD